MLTPVKTVTISSLKIQYHQFNYVFHLLCKFDFSHLLKNSITVPHPFKEVIHAGYITPWFVCVAVWYLFNQSTDYLRDQWMQVGSNGLVKLR